jgi:hypothetical protein
MNDARKHVAPDGIRPEPVSRGRPLVVISRIRLDDILLPRDERRKDGRQNQHADNHKSNFGETVHTILDFGFWILD